MTDEKAHPDWWDAIAEKYNAAMTALAEAIHINDQWVGKPDYTDAQWRMRKLLPNKTLTLGELTAFEHYVMRRFGWVADPRASFVGLVPAELEAPIAHKSALFDQAVAELKHEFDETEWFRHDFFQAVRTRQAALMSAL